MIEKILNTFFNRRDIVNCDGDVYLKRWYVIRTKFFGLFVHKFGRSDEDRAGVHSHPWNFIVIPLWRGYIEHYNLHESLEHAGVPHIGEGSRRIRPILGTRFRHHYFRHRVELIGEKSAWSIFIRFEKKHNWGFWPKMQKMLPWNMFYKEYCE